MNIEKGFNEPGNRERCNCKWDLPREKYEALVRHHINQLDESLRVSEAVWKERVRLCDRCEYQQNKMCRMCGCFVEVRASRRNMSCPLIPPVWGRV